MNQQSPILRFSFITRTIYIYIYIFHTHTHTHTHTPPLESLVYFLPFLADEQAWPMVSLVQNLPVLQTRLYSTQDHLLACVRLYGDTRLEWLNAHNTFNHGTAELCTSEMQQQEQFYFKVFCAMFVMRYNMKVQFTG